MQLWKGNDVASGTTLGSDTVQSYSFGKYSMQIVDKSWAFTESSKAIFLNVLWKMWTISFKIHLHKWMSIRALKKISFLSMKIFCGEFL